MNPFAVLRLPPSAGLSNEDVRAAWRTIAAATHPDRDDGGDPARYAEAATAYARLRTKFDRDEALADLGAGYIPPPDLEPGPGPAALTWRSARILWRRIRYGRPRRIAARAGAAAVVAYAGTWIVPGTPAEAALIGAAATWFTLTSRGDIHPPPGR